MLNVACHFWFCAEINSCPDHSDIFNSSFRKLWLIVVLPKPDPVQTSLFSACFYSWSQRRPQFECLKPLKPPPDMWLAQKNQEDQIVLGASQEGDQDWHLIPAFCMSLPTQRRSFSFQRATNETKTHLQKHPCEYPHWRTWEQKVPGATLVLRLPWQPAQSPVSTLQCHHNLQETPCWGGAHG